MPCRPSITLRGTKNSVHTTYDISVSIYLRFLGHLHLKGHISDFFIFVCEGATQSAGHPRSYAIGLKYAAKTWFFRLD